MPWPRARPPGSWRGAAADAARAEHERIARQVHRLAAEAAAVRSGLAAAADAVAGLHAGLAAAQELADGNGFTIAADGSSPMPSPMHLPLPLPAAGPAAGDGARSAVRAEIVDRIEQVLRAAGALDAELAALLRTIAADTAGPGPSPPVCAAIGVPAPPGGSGRRQRGLVVRCCRRPRGSGSSPSTPSGSATATGSRRLPGTRPTGACSASGPRCSTPTCVRCRHATTR